MKELYFKNSLGQAKAISYVIIGSALIAFGPFFVEFAEVGAVTSSFYRLLIGAAAFLLIARLRNEKFPPIQSLWLYCCAGLMITFDLVACNQSILYIGSGLSTILSNLEIFFLIVLGFFFYKENLPRLFFFTSLLILVGIGCLMQPYYTHMHPHQYLGVIYAIIASFIYSIYLLLLKIIAKRNAQNTPATTLGIVCSFGTIILGSYMCCYPTATFVVHDWNSILCVFSYGIISQVCGWWFITNGLNNISLSVSGMLFLTQPALTFIGDCLFLKRNTHIVQLFGGIVLLLAVYLTAQFEKRKESIV